MRFNEEVRVVEAGTPPASANRGASPFKQLASSPFSPSSSTSTPATYYPEDLPLVSVNGWARRDEGRLTSTSGMDEERMARMMTGRVAELQPKPEVQFELDWER